ncbi:tryptophan 2,3-dioxygenase [Pararhizobium haloflavum]|uniref:tryptophan 2,3-dioxygenase n=1 Tax=Pararhizobium haloflavum TaxID=2037914 RepID=UPI000C196D2E|nr:tryptophan 2,3-dioxygenase [Pararhizobium haloflavum]
MGEHEDSRVEAGMSVDFQGRMSYGDYLRIDTLLSAQKPLTDQPDEPLFIVIHHVQELWISLILHELRFAMDALRADKPGVAFKALARIARIQEQLISAWDVLSTMTPSDYLTFRAALGQSSGFQSHQYRMMEMMLGAKDERMLAPHRHDAAHHGALLSVFHAPSIYDEAIALLARHGIDVPPELLSRDVTRPHRFHEGLKTAWLSVYRDTHRHFELYELAEKLVDVEDRFQQWRFRHMKTVQRIIGLKTGTGGSSGVAYLKTALDRSFFPELWELRTDL